MRLLHTSDWHLGRSFHGVGLLPAQTAALEHLVQVVQREHVDAVLVSGDVYDRALPSPDAVRLLDRTLVALREAGAVVVLSSGNHDSAARLGFGSSIMAAGGVHVRTDPAAVAEPVEVGDVDVYPLPYLEPALVAEQLGATELTHASVLRAAMRRVHERRVERGRPGVAMAHLFAAGATTSDSERDIAVGGLAAVPAEVFDGLAYTALGHLHRPQAVTDRVRYSGSPVAMSFSEADQGKEALLVDLDGDRCGVSPVAVPPYRPVATLRGELEHLLEDPAHAHAEQAWVQVTLTDADRPARAMERVRSRFPGCLQLLFDGDRPTGDRRSYAERVAGRGDVDLCCDFLDHVRERPADEGERALLHEAVAGAAAARRIRDAEGDEGRTGEAGAA